jgi:hypothetical protein
MKTQLSLTIAILVFCTSFGCNGGATVELGEIQGPDSIKETTTVEFSITVDGATGISYQWSCYPVSAGSFDSPNSAKTKFVTAAVQDDSAVEIWVLITTDQYGPVLKRKDITVIDYPGWVYDWPDLEGSTVAVNSSGDTFLTGGLIGTVDFDPGQGIDEYSTPVGFHHGTFLTKFDSEGRYQWAKTWGGSITYVCTSVALDSLGYVYVVGGISGTTDLDPGPGIDEHAALGSWDIFLSKFDGNSEYQWGRTFGGEGMFPIVERPMDMAIDGSGNIFVIGEFRGKIDLDPGPGKDEHSTNGGLDAFLCKYDSDGNYHWGRTWGGSEWEEIDAVAIDSSGNIYAGGSFEGNVDFDPGPGTNEHSTGGERDAFITQFDTNGNFMWVRNWGYPGEETIKDIVVGGSDRIYVLGTYIGETDFDPDPWESVIKGYIYSGISLSRFNTDGDLIWVQTWEGGGFNRGPRLAVDDNGNLYIVGLFEGVLDFDPGPAINERTSNGDEDAYLLALDADGYFSWVHTWGGDKDDLSRCVVTDCLGNIFVTGNFKHIVDFGFGPVSDIRTAMFDHDYIIRFPPGGEW